MTKYVEWEEPWNSDGPTIYNVTCRMLVDDVIAWQRGREPRYTSDERALDDFLVVHWAIIKEYE